MDKDEKHKIICEVFGTRPYWSPMPFGLRKTRNQLPELIKRFGFTEGAELGIRDGDFSVLLCKANPNLHLHCVDAWLRYGSHTQENQDTRYQRCSARLSNYNTTIIRESTFDAVNHFKKSQLDFIYIDAGHTFDECMLDLVLWSKKVKRGGLIAVHDYHLTGTVATAVEAYVRGHGVEKWFKTPEQCPTVFWVH